MNEPHRALIVEDDQTLAEDLREILASMSCEIDIASNKHDALEHLKTRPFCFMLLDLQIKQLATSMKGHVEYGHSLLREAREMFKAHSGLLPIVVITGTPLDIESAVDIMRSGADHLLQKPAKSRVVSEAVRSVLERSGRATHGHCKTTSVVPAPHKPAGLHLTIPGTREGRRTLVRLGDTTSALPNATLKTLLQLMVGHLSQQPVHKTDMNPRQEHGFKEIWRLRDQLRIGDKNGAAVIESAHNGFYRMHRDVVIGECDTDSLKELEDHRIAALAAQLRQLLDAAAASEK